MKTKPGQTPACDGLIYNFARNGEIHRHQPGHLVRGLTLGLGIGLVAAMTGCVGVVDGDGGGAVVVADPGPYWFGDWGWGGGGWRGDSHRGSVSRGGGHGGGHGGGGHGGGGRR